MILIALLMIGNLLWTYLLWRKTSQIGYGLWGDAELKPWEKGYPMIDRIKNLRAEHNALNRIVESLYKASPEKWEQIEKGDL